MISRFASSMWNTEMGAPSDCGNLSFSCSTKDATTVRHLVAVNFYNNFSILEKGKCLLNPKCYTEALQTED